MQEATARNAPPESFDGARTTPSVSDEAVMARFLEKPGFLLARIDQISTSIQSGAASGETLAQAEFLLLLETLGPVAQIELARAAGVDKSTTAYVLDNLEERGWAARSGCDDDRRRALVSLTDAARARLGRTRAEHAEMQRLMLAPLAEGDRPRLIALLHRIGARATGPAPLWLPACHPTMGVLDRAPSFLCRRALQQFQAQFGACAAPLNLTLRQFSLLVILGLRPAITQVGFARLFGLDPSTCAVILRNLAGRGLITGERSPHDGRERIYAISAKGRDVLAAAQPMVDESEALVLAGVAAEDAAWLVRQLQAIVLACSDRLRFPGALGALRPV